MKRMILILMLLITNIPGDCQDSVPKKFEWNGYIKDLQSVVFTNKFQNAGYTNLIHNRLNFKWKPSEEFTGALEIRNRFYWGSDVRSILLSSHSLRNANEKIDLSKNWYSHGNTIFHSNVERLWAEYRRPKWNVRAGRQRVNWGMANTWNPNDIFNTYNFLDFDYEERPGCDALKAQYITGDMSNAEVAISSSGNNKAIVAARYFFNMRGYDFQVLSGLYQNSFTSGFGWAGSIGDLGFKGEAQLFLNKYDSLNSFNTTAELDYIFKNGWYLNAGFLYNLKGLTSPPDHWSDISFEISPFNLMPAKWTMLLSTSKEFTPLFSGSLAMVYSPGVNMLIFYPSFKYNLFQDMDIDLVWQSFFSELNGTMQGITHAGFFRVKWTF